MVVHTLDNVPIPEKMWAAVTTGNGGFEKLEYRQVATPTLDSEDNIKSNKKGSPSDYVLIKVLAAGVNNTEINTRLGWYSSKIREGTTQAVSAEQQATGGDRRSGDDVNMEKNIQGGGWNEATPFPLIQGTDCCGIVFAVVVTPRSGGVDEKEDEAADETTKALIIIFLIPDLHHPRPERNIIAPK